MATHTQAILIARYVDEGVKKIGGEKDPVKARSIVDTYVVDEIRKSQPPGFLESLAAMDIQETMDAHPGCPNIPILVPTGAPGVSVLTNQNIVTTAELSRQMEENNAKLLEAMRKIVAEQNAANQPPAGGNN